MLKVPRKRKLLMVGGGERQNAFGSLTMEVNAWQGVGSSVAARLAGTRERSKGREGTGLGQPVLQGPAGLETPGAGVCIVRSAL